MKNLLLLSVDARILEATLLVKLRILNASLIFLSQILILTYSFIFHNNDFGQKQSSSGYSQCCPHRCRFP